ncbi:basic membrane protein [Treponema vincentii ATCC 35580]|uniref:Basic membrane protein n=1 Tax=Treponema vincentii ATCC 35580 TaxID=596324 RepID=C8PPT6_9SPIR|nr:BMP family ABC transporter substrate-binding protein [Treponema vincentii]EEV20536.1 basic membrane protein [Treponema vincentii ATCC 35580]
MTLKQKIIMLICSLALIAGAPLFAKTKAVSVAVFVPGIVKGNPTYELLVEGVQEAKAQLDKKGQPITVKVVEGGVNQGEWQNGLTALAISKKYDLIISSNPSLPAIAEKVLQFAPQQKFLLLDGYLAGNAQIKTVGFNHYEQGYLNGYYAALISTSTMKNANAAYKIGLLAGQEYPVMNDKIRKGYLDGAKAVNKNFELDFRVLGNWYDAAKASELAVSMIKNNADVILTICGGGNAGVVAAARENGAYVMWFDRPGYSYGKDIVVGSTEVSQKTACTDSVIAFVEGRLEFGKPVELGIKNDAVGFAFEGVPSAVPQTAIQKVKQLIDDIKSGKTTLSDK